MDVPGLDGNGVFGNFLLRFGKLWLYWRMGLMRESGFVKGYNVKRSLALMGWMIL